MWILISRLYQKPTDLDLQYFQERINPASAGQGLMPAIACSKYNDGELTMSSGPSHLCLNGVL